MIKKVYVKVNKYIMCIGVLNKVNKKVYVWNLFIVFELQCNVCCSNMGYKIL